MIDIHKVPSPCYVMDEALLRKNLSLIKSVADRAGVEIILAFKSFAMWKSFPIFREYIRYTTASSVYEARLAYEEFGSKAHTYSPAYTDTDFPVIMRCSSHITFNSFSQFRRFYPMVEAFGEKITCGIRINPEYSDVETDLYNPCAPGSRMGVVSDLLDGQLPDGVEGLHFHTLCESSSYDLEKTLGEVEKRFGIQIDSLSDIVCFGVAPAVLCYCFGMRGVIGVAILMFYVLAGLIRLAWFNVMEEQRQEETTEKRECYQGLPITSMAIALPLVVVLKPFLGCEFMLALHVVMLVVGILFITNFKLKKPKNVTMGAIVAVVAMAVIAILVRHYMRYMSMM